MTSKYDFKAAYEGVFVNKTCALWEESDAAEAALSILTRVQSGELAVAPVMATDDQALPCPFCGSRPKFELGQLTGCQLHGDPIQYLFAKCSNKQCHGGRGLVRGNDIYKYGEKGEHLERGKKEAREDAIKNWNKRASPSIEELMGEQK